MLDRETQTVFGALNGGATVFRVAARARFESRNLWAANKICRRRAFNSESCVMGGRAGAWAGERVLRLGDAISTNAQPDKVEALSIS